MVLRAERLEIEVHQADRGTAEPQEGETSDLRPWVWSPVQKYTTVPVRQGSGDGREVRGPVLRWGHRGLQHGRV